jgi:hypothetical protein
MIDEPTSKIFTAGGRAADGSLFVQPKIRPRLKIRTEAMMVCREITAEL